MTILVVDDDSIIRDTVGLLLTDLGHCVEQASDGLEALCCLDRALPDLVLSDIQMPNMEGLELLRIIHRRYPKLPVVMMTGHSTFETVVGALRAHAFDYLKKPIQFADLQACLERVETERLREE